MSGFGAVNEKRGTQYASRSAVGVVARLAGVQIECAGGGPRAVIGTHRRLGPQLGTDRSR